MIINGVWDVVGACYEDFGSFDVGTIDCCLDDVILCGILRSSTFGGDSDSLDDNLMTCNWIWFQYPPYTFTEAVDGVIKFNGGIEVAFLEELRKYFNFNYDVINCMDNWGTFHNGTWTGIVGKVFYQVIFPSLRFFMFLSIFLSIFVCSESSSWNWWCFIHIWT